MAQISELKAKRIAPGDKPLADGVIRGLRLMPGSAKGQGKWILRFVSPVSGKRRDLGLGRYPDVSIADVRIRGLEARRLIGCGKDPIVERDANRSAAKAVAVVPTFEQVARQVHEELKLSWKNAKHRDQWINTLRDYAFPKIGDIKVADIGPADFADVLRPIWLEKPETAYRIRQRCHKVMKWCWAQEIVKGNPVDVVDHLLPKQPRKRERTKHQPSMPWREAPEFVKKLRSEGANNVTRALLEFVILTAARSGEARAMTWDEIDLEAKIWTVPASRMKTKVMHRVPLSDRAVEILKAQFALHPNAELVFPSPRGKVLSDMVLTKFLRDQKAASSDKGRVATAHGFRSSFRDWASENGHPRDLAERALSHTISNRVEAAYHRTDLLEQRRPMMEAWSDFVSEQEVTCQ